ncbi:MAG: glycosyltransferase [Anaerolineae bacterium]|nr:glycosyltransferase [Anaerolineae bacterium]
MHILHLTPYYAPAIAFGGVVSAVTGLAMAQAALGHRVSVLTTDALDRATRIDKQRERIDGVEVFRVRNLLPALRARVNLSTPLGIGRMVRQLQPDVIHIHELRTVENLLTLLPTSPAPVILSPHGTLPYSTGSRANKRGWDALFGKPLMRRINAVTALTEAEAEDVRNLWQELHLHVPSITVIPNGVRLDMPTTGDLRARYSIPADAVVVLFLGRLHERKGIQLLIPAFAQATNGSNARLLIAGPDEGMLTELQRIASEQEIADRVIFAGILTGADRDAALRTADIFALPAIGEGLSMASLEAMAAGIPMLLTPGCNLPEVESRGAGLLVEREIGALAAGLARLLNLPEAARRKLGEHAQAWMRESFGWHSIAERTLECYRQLIS